MASFAAPARPDTLRLRVVSAVVLAPFPVAAIWFGSPWLPILTVVAGAIMGWEWARLCRQGSAAARGFAVGDAAVIATVVVAVLCAWLFAQAVVAVAAAAAGAILVWRVARQARDRAALWMAFGTLWVALPCVALLWIARDGGSGRTTLLWLFAVVWATDIGAYVIGRRLGGPRLAPRWSPRKTWAGLIGGACCAALAGWVTARWLGISPVLPLVAISAGLAIIEQFGDLAESVAKRRFGVKDSSGLIPGHGGLLDRLDGLLAAAPAVALLTLIGGSSVLTWH